MVWKPSLATVFSVCSARVSSAFKRSLNKPQFLRDLSWRASGQRAREGAQGILMSNVSLGGNNYSKNWISFRSWNWIYKKLTEHILASAWLSLWGRHLAGVLTLSSGMLEFQFQVHPVFCIHCSFNWAATAGLTAWWNPGWSGHLIPHLRFLYVYVLSLELCPIQLFATLWTVAHQAVSMGFSRQEYWSGLPCPPPGDTPHPGIEPVFLTSPALTGRFFNTSATWDAPYMYAAAAELLQSCPTLSDPVDGSPPGSPSLGFSRQEHWSGLPFPSPMHESEK